MSKVVDLNQWIKKRIKPAEINKYLGKDKPFIDQVKIERTLKDAKADPIKIKDILDKAKSIESLNLEETAVLLSVNDPQILDAMQEAAFSIKKKVYDNRIVTFSPLYLGNYCVNDCLYCGFRKTNCLVRRKVLSEGAIKEEVRVLAGKIGHKRLIVVYGEHPSNDIEYMLKSIDTIYKVKAKTKKRSAQIRRVNVNAPPLQIKELVQLPKIGIGTYQVFQETYHLPTYKKLHPEGTIKSDYLWRLYVMHRALEAGIDDIGLGVLFGLYDFRFEVMGLVAHALELEKKFGVGPHTISFPRLEPAANTPYSKKRKYQVGNRNLRKIILTLRLAVPYTGMIITARENRLLRKNSLFWGITQTDASTKIGIGSYSKKGRRQTPSSQQFLIGDTRSLDAAIREFSSLGFITSFCTAGYRCGRTGKCIMDLLRSGQEGKFCKLNAVLTFREWLDDFASTQTRRVSEKVIASEIEEIKNNMPLVYPKFLEAYRKIQAGKRDIYF